ncbi:MAG: thermonuclease family protein [Chloroflexi bacterium]|nr:thermonuclease family protein [Chloroflexota bacterium]
MREALGIPYRQPYPGTSRPFGEGRPFGDQNRPDVALERFAFQGAVEQVIDGHSLLVRAGPRRLHVRLLGIDAPDPHGQHAGQEPWGGLALRRLQALAPRGTRVRLVTDRQVFDPYGRLLAFVYRGQHNLNLEMLRSGWAVCYPIYPNVALLDRLQAATRAAMAARRGIFDARRPLPLLPDEFRRQTVLRPPDLFCGDTRTRRYVLPTEYQRVPVTRRVFFFTREDARAFGYLPAGMSLPAADPVIEQRDGTLTPAEQARIRLRDWQEAGYPRSG